MHWLQLVSLANSQPAASSPEGAGGLAQRGSRSFENTKPSQQGPRGSRNSGSRRACTAGAPLPLPGVPTSHSPSHEVEARKEAARAAKLAEAAEHRREETFGVLTICFMVVSVSKRCSTKRTRTMVSVSLLKRRGVNPQIALVFTSASVAEVRRRTTSATVFSRRSTHSQVVLPELRIRLLRGLVLLFQPSSVSQQ